MKTKFTFGAVVALVLFLASPAFAQDSPPALPTLPPDEPTTGGTTTSTTDTITTATTSGTGTTGTTGTASTASSGPVETLALVGLAIIAFFGLKQYISSKKYKL